VSSLEIETSGELHLLPGFASTLVSLSDSNTAEYNDAINPVSTELLNIVEYSDLSLPTVAGILMPSDYMAFYGFGLEYIPRLNHRVQLLIHFSTYEWAIDEQFSNIPKSISTIRNHPNPFNSATKFEIDGFDEIEIEIIDKNGKVIDKVFATSGTATWHPNNIASGIYFARVSHNGDANQTKLIYIK
jgi:hypothetical protein